MALRLRACWVTHSPDVLAVTPELWTRRAMISTKNKTQSCRRRYDLKLWITHSSKGATYLPR